MIHNATTCNNPTVDATVPYLENAFKRFMRISVPVNTLFRNSSNINPEAINLASKGLVIEVCHLEKVEDKM